MINYLIELLAVTSDEVKGIVVLSVIIGTFFVLSLIALLASEPWRDE